MDIYLDNASTTKVREEVRLAMEPWLSGEYGNPSSHHALGRRASEEVWRARDIIAKTIGATPEEIFFTSGGSEANTWAVCGLYCIDNGGDVIMSSIEHHSLLNIRKKKKLIGVNSDGIIDIGQLDKTIQYDTPIVCTMAVNNEIGTIEPIKEIDEVCYKHEVFLHVDAVQAFCHIPINVRDYLCMSTMSASAHKIGGPKGVGFLYIQKDVQKLYHPLISGGQQEFGLRGGTENVAGIVGFGKACEIAASELQHNYDKNKLLAYELEMCFLNEVSYDVNGYDISCSEHIPNIINLRFDGVRAEELLELLNENGIYVSSGSACNSDSAEPSHVLTAIGLNEDEANSSIRISFSSSTTKEEVIAAAKVIIGSVKILKGR